MAKNEQDPSVLGQVAHGCALIFLFVVGGCALFGLLDKLLR